MSNNIYTTNEQLTNQLSRLPSLRSIYAGCALTAGIDIDGELQYSSTNFAYLSTKYWINVVQLALDKYHPDVIFGLKADKTCVVGKCPFAGWASYNERYSGTRMGNDSFGWLLRSVHNLNGIVQIAVNGSHLFALDEDGMVHAIEYRSTMNIWTPFTPSLSEQIAKSVRSWHDVRHIILAEEEVVIAQMNNGELLCAGSTQDLYGTFGEKDFVKLQDTQIVDACAYFGGESKYYAFLDAENNIHGLSRRFAGADGKYFVQIVGLDHSFLGLKDNGEIVSFQGIETDKLHWPGMKQISIGKESPIGYDNVFLVGLSRGE